MESRTEYILSDLKDLLRLKLSDNIQDVVLFGSRATDKHHKDSDYDILIVLKNNIDWKTERELSDLCYEIDLKYNILTDSHIITNSELHTLRGKQPIFVNALKNGLRA